MLHHVACSMRLSCYLLLSSKKNLLNQPSPPCHNFTISNPLLVFEGISWRKGACPRWFSVCDGFTLSNWINDLNFPQFRYCYDLTNYASFLICWYHTIWHFVYYSAFTYLQATSHWRTHLVLREVLTSHPQSLVN